MKARSLNKEGLYSFVYSFVLDSMHDETMHSIFALLANLSHSSKNMFYCGGV
jgi:hypothetical protein